MSRGDAPASLDFVEEPFDQIARSEKVRADATRLDLISGMLATRFVHGRSPDMSRPSRNRRDFSTSDVCAHGEHGLPLT
jgi:hypothetical protein